MNTGHVNKMHELLTNRRGHIWWSYCIFWICFVHQTSTNAIIVIMVLIIVIIFYPTTLDLQPLSTLAPSDLWQKTSPSLKRVKNNIFSTEISSKNILFFLWTNILFPISSSSPHHPLEVEAGRSKAGALLLLFKNRDNHLHKVNRCLARYSPRASTTNRALNKPAWPGPNWPKMPILGQIWSFLGKKSFFLLEKS